MRALRIITAFLRRDFLINVSYRAGFGFELAAIVLSLALFFYLSPLINNREFAASQDVSGDYFAYVAVGMFLYRIIISSLNSFTRKLRDEQTTGTFEALMATPVSPTMIILPSAAYDLLRATLSGLILMAAALVIFGLQLEVDAGSLAAAAVAMIGSLGLFASIGVAVGAITVIVKRATAVLGLVLTALALLGGVYFPIDLLPGALEFIASILPFTWALDVLRASLLGGDVDPVQLAGLFASAAVLLPASLLAFSLAVRRAQRTGTLAEY